MCPNPYTVCNRRLIQAPYLPLVGVLVTFTDSCEFLLQQVFSSSHSNCLSQCFVVPSSPDLIPLVLIPTAPF